MGAKAWRHASPAANYISKPLETVGRKAMGAKVRLHYASPVAGVFASEIFAKKGQYCENIENIMQ